MKIIFMGTAQFACPALQKLIISPQIEVMAVYTKEPKIAGRGHKVTNSPIHNLALKHNLKIITPKSLKDQKIQQEFLNFKADAAIVVAYGLILPTAILQGTKLGCINIHPSLLPKWRGAAPIQRTLMAGDTQTGITIIKMDEGIDSGDIIYQEKFPLDNDITYQELAEKCGNQGAEILLRSLNNINSHNNQFTRQDHSQAVYAHKISKEEAQINWKLPARQVNNHIRGLSGNISSYFIHQEQRIKILKAQIIETLTNINIHNQPTLPAGTIIDNQFNIACQEGIIRPLILQKSGKNKITIEEFLRGYKIINTQI